MKPVLIGLYSSSMRSGKSTAASILTEALFGTTMSFATPLYDYVVKIAAEFLGEQEVYAWLRDQRKDTAIIPGLGVTLRSMLQTLGTTWGRDCVHKDLWVLLAEAKAKKALRSYSVIFDDMRFPNEFEMVKRNGGHCIRVDRPGEGRGDTGIGEGLLDGHLFDLTIYNHSTLSDLKKNVWYVKEYLNS